VSSELTNVERMRRLPWLYASTLANTVFCLLTFFGSVFVMFLDALKLDKAQIGFLLSLLPFAGLIAVPIAPTLSRFGCKRIFITFYGARKAITALLLLTPWVLARYGEAAAFWFVAAVVLAFALARAVAETAWTSWFQEVIPNHVRGKVGAVNTIGATVAGIVTLSVAGYVVGRFTDLGLSRFIILIAVGVVAGGVSILFYSGIPGGAANPSLSTGRTEFAMMTDALRDANFRLYLLGLAAVTFGLVPLLSFVPLYMKEQIGLNPGRVVYLDVGYYLGLLASCYLWGWASDRYGSKPVMLSGLCMLLALPVLWFLMPAHSVWSLGVAMAIALLLGMASQAWGTGFSRYLYVTAVPPESRTAYMPIFYAWAGLTAGLAPLLAGWFLDRWADLNFTVAFLRVTPFTPLFAVCVALLAAGIMIMSRVRTHGEVSTPKFLGMFFQGNPLMAMESLVRYRWAGDERQRIHVTQRLGQARNPLSVNELVEALHDPSFNVRYEAITAISKMPPEPVLVDELLMVLGGDEPDLAIAAAWALGRLGDSSAVLPLRETLLSDYPLLRAHSARALAALNDRSSIPFLLDQFREECNDGVCLAYASALGVLRAAEAIDDLLAALERMGREAPRQELALALARIAGSERNYIGLWRGFRTDPGTAAAQALLNLRKSPAADPELRRLMEQCVHCFARNDLALGAQGLCQILDGVCQKARRESLQKILGQCAACLRRSDQVRPEYLQLALHAIALGLNSRC